MIYVPTWLHRKFPENIKYYIFSSSSKVQQAVTYLINIGSASRNLKGGGAWDAAKKLIKYYRQMEPQQTYSLLGAFICIE
jgi:hypothetical protein